MTGFADEFLDQMARLRDLEKEYRVTLLVLSVLVEQMLRMTGGTSVEIADSALADAPDLNAWRNEQRYTVELAVSRS